MKKLFITMVFVAATMFASAQLFVGGNLGIDMGTQKNKYDGTTRTDAKTFGFDFNPSVGFMFSDNMGVGLDITFGFAKITNPKTDSDPENIDKVTTIGFAPYFRYVFAEVDNFNFYCDAKVNFSTAKAKNTNDGETSDGNKTMELGVNVVPGVQYNFTDNISMVASLNVLKLGWNMEKVTSPKNAADNETVVTRNGFGLGINDATPLTVGFVYTF